MTEPTFSETAERMYSVLPEHYRREDQHQDYQLKLWVSAMFDELGDVNTVLERLDFDALKAQTDHHETSELVDPENADAAWLPWIGQLLGIKITGNETVEQQRAKLHTRWHTGFADGNIHSMMDAASFALVGDKYVNVYPRSTAAPDGIGTGTMWDMLIVTKESETLETLVPPAWTYNGTPGVWFYMLNSLDPATPALIERVGFFLDRAMRVVTPTDYHVNFGMSATGPVESLIPVTLDAHTAFISVYSEAPVARPATLQIWWYRSGFAGNNGRSDLAVTIQPGMNQLVYSNITPPANTTHASISIDIPDALAGEIYDFAEPGMRLGANAPVDFVPVSADPVRAVIEAGMKPAGVILHHKTFEATWDVIEAQRPTWDDWEAAGSWTEIEETGL